MQQSAQVSAHTVLWVCTHAGRSSNTHTQLFPWSNEATQIKVFFNKKYVSMPKEVLFGHMLIKILSHQTSRHLLQGQAI